MNPQNTGLTEKQENQSIIISHHHLVKLKIPGHKTTTHTLQEHTHTNMHTYTHRKITLVPPYPWGI